MSVRFYCWLFVPEEAGYSRLLPKVVVHLPFPHAFSSCTEAPSHVGDRASQQELWTLWACCCWGKADCLGGTDWLVRHVVMYGCIMLYMVLVLIGNDWYVVHDITWWYWWHWHMPECARHVTSMTRNLRVWAWCEPCHDRKSCHTCTCFLKPSVCKWLNMYDIDLCSINLLHNFMWFHTSHNLEEECSDASHCFSPSLSASQVVVSAAVTRVFSQSIEVAVRVSSNSVNTQDTPTEVGWCKRWCKSVQFWCSNELLMKQCSSVFYESYIYSMISIKRSSWST